MINGSNTKSAFLTLCINTQAKKWFCLKERKCGKEVMIRKGFKKVGTEKGRERKRRMLKHIEKEIVITNCKRERQKENNKQKRKTPRVKEEGI